MDVKLFNENKDLYKGDYDNHLFEQYKIYIQSIENISERRHSAINYFITINTALISALGLSFNIEFLSELVAFKIILLFIGLAVSIVFWYLINSYKQINTGKFKVLHEIESHLPLSLYKYEWEVLAHGKNKKVYYPFSHIELLLPWLLGIAYFVLALFFIF
jgi:hypothetical protein